VEPLRSGAQLEAFRSLQLCPWGRMWNPSPASLPLLPGSEVNRFLLLAPTTMHCLTTGSKAMRPTNLDSWAKQPSPPLKRPSQVSVTVMESWQAHIPPQKGLLLIFI
jgi:hypothetical protein